MEFLSAEQISKLDAGTVVNLKSGNVMKFNENATKGIMNAIGHGAPFRRSGGTPGEMPGKMPVVEASDLSIDGLQVEAYLVVSPK